MSCKKYNAILDEAFEKWGSKLCNRCYNKNAGKPTCRKCLRGLVWKKKVWGKCDSCYLQGKQRKLHDTQASHSSALRARSKVVRQVQRKGDMMVIHYSISSHGGDV